jgi:uncharacterized protein
MTAGQPEAPHFPRLAPIDAYGNGGFRFAEMSHRGSILCLPRGMWAWPVTEPDAITFETLASAAAVADDIDTLILGTGRDIWMPPESLRAHFRARRVVLDAMQTGPAIRIYNIMVGERRRVAAALIAVS